MFYFWFLSRHRNPDNEYCPAMPFICDKASLELGTRKNKLNNKNKHPQCIVPTEKVEQKKARNTSYCDRGKHLLQEIARAFKAAIFRL